MSAGIVWLASFPKSGNTWVRAFLANLLCQDGKPYDINRLSQFNLSDVHERFYREVADRPLEQLSDGELNALRPDAHRRIAGAYPHSIFVKTHQVCGVVNGVPIITPDVTRGAVYIVRNPLDIVISYAHFMNLDIDLAIDFLDVQIANHNAFKDVVKTSIRYQYLGTWSENVLSWTGAPGLKRHVVRYEDLLAAPEERFAALADFLDIDVEPGRIARAVRFSSFPQLQAQESRHGFRERPPLAQSFFRQGRAGDWHKLLTAAQVDRIVEKHGPVMARYGYLP